MAIDIDGDCAPLIHPTLAGVVGAKSIAVVVGLASVMAKLAASLANRRDLSTAGMLKGGQDGERAERGASIWLLSDVARSPPRRVTNLKLTITKFCRATRSRRTRHPAMARDLSHPFEVEERDKHFGRAEPNQASQLVRSQNNRGAGHIRVGFKCRCCRLYVIAFRLCIVKCQPISRAATSHRSAGTNAADRCRCANRHSVGPEATSCLAARS